MTTSTHLTKGTWEKETSLAKNKNLHFDTAWQRTYENNLDKDGEEVCMPRCCEKKNNFLWHSSTHFSTAHQHNTIIIAIIENREDSQYVEFIRRNQKLSKRKLLFFYFFFIFF